MKTKVQIKRAVEKSLKIKEEMKKLAKSLRAEKEKTGQNDRSDSAVQTGST